MKKLAIFASGSGSNAENLAHYFNQKNYAEIDSIFCNKEDAFVFERAKKLNIDAFYFSNSDFKKGDKLLEILNEREVDFIILAGYLLKVPENILKNFENKIINIHPALLPNYGGKGMYGMNVHKAVIENKESISGITIHYVNENYDEGQIIFQSSVVIDKNETPESLAGKIHNLEYMHFPVIVDNIIKESL